MPSFNTLRHPGTAAPAPPQSFGAIPAPPPDEPAPVPPVSIVASEARRGTKKRGQRASGSGRGSERPKSDGARAEAKGGKTLAEKERPRSQVVENSQERARRERVLAGMTLELPASLPPGQLSRKQTKRLEKEARKQEKAEAKLRKKEAKQKKEPVRVIEVHYTNDDAWG